MIRTMNRNILTMICLAGVLTAQTAMEVRKAELSVPLGSASGYIVYFDGNIAFVNEERPDRSLHIDKSNITNASSADGTVVVATKEPVYGLTEFRFELAAGSAALELSPEGSSPMGATASTSRSVAGSTALDLSYQARHNHFPRGSCQGHLIIRGGRISFESLTNANHSEQWTGEDIKEIKRKSPYKLEITPFSGNGYDFELLRQGMTTEEFKMITAMVASSRVPR